MTDNIQSTLYSTQDLKAGDMICFLGRTKETYLVTNVTEEEFEDVALSQGHRANCLHENLSSASVAIYRDGAKIFGDEKANELWLKRVLASEG